MVGLDLCLFLIFGPVCDLVDVDVGFHVFVWLVASILALVVLVGSEVL